MSRAPLAKRARFELDSARRPRWSACRKGLWRAAWTSFWPRRRAKATATTRSFAARRTSGTCSPVRARRSQAAARGARGLFLAVEAATRGQAACDLWWLLRRSLATASSVRWGAAGPRPLVRLGRGAAEERNTAATAFGRDNEPLARALVRACCVPPGDLPTPDGLADGEGRANELGPVFVFDAAAGAAAESAAGADAEAHTCGLLIDPRTGALGASIDMLVCDRDARGELAPHPTQTALGVFEIKCRAKYAFDPDDGARRRARTPPCCGRSAAALRAFLRSVRRPGVEHCPPDGCPGAAEALASCADAWAPPPPAGAAPARRCSEFDWRHLALNRSVTSRVWLFNEPAAHSGAIGLATWDTGEAALEAPLFANPRHANFKQILVQSYVLAGHFPERAAAPHLVTFIGRQRRAREQGPLEVRAGPGAETCTVPREGAVPVLLIATPVVVDGELARESLEQPAREAFRAAVKESWDRRRRAADAAATAS
nr:MAG: UL12 protein [Bovine alphaherpesvirus 1]